MENIQIHHEKEQQAKNPCCIGLWHLLAGVLMVLLGLYVWFHPMTGLYALSLYIGVALIVVGAGYIGSSLQTDSGWFMFVGLIDIIVGLILVSELGVTTATLPVIFAVWCLAVGLAQLVSAYRFGRNGLPWGWSALLGALGVVFGLLILQYPALGAVTISILTGLYLVLYGVLEILEYFYFRKRERTEA
jgi:uncharacterized membrane protein HdeD (DUF308 family)